MKFFILAAVLIFLVIIVLLCLKANDEVPSDNNKSTNQYKPKTQAPPKQYTPQQTIGNINPPALTNHARERMRERMNICDEYSQVEMMKRAYQYGNSVAATQRQRLR